MKIYSTSVFFLGALSIKSDSVTNADEFLSDLLSNEDFIECNKDTLAMVDDYPELDDASIVFLDSLEIGVNDDTVSMSVVFSKDQMDIYQQACTAASGYFDQMNGSIACSMVGVDDVMAINFENFASCVSDTKECKALEISAFLEQLMESSGFECDVSTASGSENGGSSASPPDDAAVVSSSKSTSGAAASTSNRPVGIAVCL